MHTRTLTLTPFRTAAVLFSVLLITNRVSAQEVAQLYSFQGVVEERPASSGSLPSTWHIAKLGEKFQHNASVRTGEKSRAALRFYDGILMRLGQTSMFHFGTKDANQSELNLAQGRFHFFSRDPRIFPKLTTSLVSAAARGTEFIVEAHNDQTLISVLQGQVSCSNSYGSVDLGAGEEALTLPGRAPVKRILVNPNDAVQWTLFYPAVLSIKDFPDLAIARQAQKVPAWASTMAASMDLYLKGDAYAAAQRLSNYYGQKPAGMLLFESALALSAGETGEAEKLLDSAEGLLPVDSGLRAPIAAGLYAQRAIIALVRDDKNSAQEALKRAQGLAASSSAVLLATSYVAQAFFDLEGARNALQRALDQDPRNPLLEARLAEIELSFGETRRARELSESAIQLGDENAYVLTVAGFSALSSFDTRAARAHFEKAVAMEGTGSLPHLGLGLAYIREGDLERGTIELTEAAHLEPNVSLYRSYLGKAYFESEKESLALREYARAIELDPHDPTPHLYRAFSHLSANAPVSALADIEKSIELNRSRAVYRSRLLLDQDLGVRGISLSQIFTRLTFHDVARVEAIRSLGRDYSNPSAHLLLSESNRNLGLNQASLSESIVGRLLLPVNYNSILPSSSSDASFNEYNALFDRATARSLVGASGETEDNLLQGEAQHVHNFGRFGYGLSVKHRVDDGKHDHDRDLQDEIQASFQGQLTESDNMLLDLSAKYNDEEFSGDNASTETDLEDATLGYHHHFGPGSHLIGQVRYTESGRERIATSLSPPRPLHLFPTNTTVKPTVGNANVLGDTDEDFSGGRTDLQYIFDSDLASFVIGGGALDADVSRDEEGTVSSFSPLRAQDVDVSEGQGRNPSRTPPPSIIGTSVVSNGDANERSQRGFLYSTWHFADLVDLDIGGAFSRLELTRGSGDAPFVDGNVVRRKFLPKTGFSLYPTDRLALRSAYFKTAGVAGFTDLTKIEPTVVGGFNQTFDEFPGSIADGYGAGFDYKIPNSTYFGSEYFVRDFEEDIPGVVTEFSVTREPPNFSIDDFVVTPLVRDVRSNRVRSYLYQLLSSEACFTAEHAWMHDTTDFTGTKIEDSDAIINLSNADYTTNRVNLGLLYFSPSGWFTFGRGQWRHQDAETRSTSQQVGDFATGTTAFWLFDVGAGYQFAARHGAIQLEVRNLFDKNFSYLRSNDERQLSEGINLLFSTRYNF